MKLKLETECDGSLVINGVVVYCPTKEFTAEMIADIVKTYNAAKAKKAQ